VLADVPHHLSALHASRATIKADTTWVPGHHLELHAGNLLRLIPFQSEGQKTTSQATSAV
jgi:hypothetical protein